MLLIISPAKTLNFEKTELATHSQPTLLKNSRQLIQILKKMKVNDLRALMDISEKLAVENVARFQQFKTPFTLDNAKQAILAFKGDVYQGLDAADFSKEDLEFAQAHLRILSGLYGVLRPLDLMQAYRLEMGTALENERGKNLYAFWGDTIAKELNKALRESGKAIVNLASNEYWSAVQVDKLKVPIYNIHFKEARDGQLKIISFNAKKARGLMCRYAVKNRLSKPEELRSFDWEGYRLAEALSSKYEWVFVREGQ